VPDPYHSIIFARQFERAIASAKRMIELNPNSGVSCSQDGGEAAFHCACPIKTQWSSILELSRNDAEVAVA
jgi:hypothetical protein